MRKGLSLLTGLFIFVFLPFLGWGINQYSTFLSNPYRTSFIAMMTVLSALVVFFVPDNSKMGDKGMHNIKSHRISLFLLQVIPIIIILAAPYSDHRDIAVLPDIPLIRALGLLTALTGFVIMNLAVIALDRQFSVNVTIQHKHELITKGIYHYVRHPRYLGILLFFMGIALVFNSWGCLLFTSLLLPVLIWRIKDEDKLLSTTFNEAWLAYKKQTGCLLPRFMNKPN